MTSTIRPPLARGMRLLDRDFFRQTINLAAARIPDSQKISTIRTALQKANDTLNIPRQKPIRIDPSNPGQKCILLHETIKPYDKSTWPPVTTSLVNSGDVSIFEYPFLSEYSHWDSRDILLSIFPEDFKGDIPTSFNQVGHIAHFNLRSEHDPFKEIIGQVTIDKNPSIKTVVNKTELLGEENDDNEFRVLRLEVIAGEPEFKVELKESGCTFPFDFSKVFWNSRLGAEHERLVALFEPGEAICDVMSGVGPFAVPAGKKGCFVLANDLNPDCKVGLDDAIRVNKVGEFVQGYCEDGHQFIKNAARRLRETKYVAKVPIKGKKISRTEVKARGGSPGRQQQQVTEIERPRVFSHFIMNLPASATAFLPNYMGVYEGCEELFEPHTTAKLPMVHCYCFAWIPDEEHPETEDPKVAICKVLSEQMGYQFTPDMPELDIYDVRDLAPRKHQFCASFRLPAEVAFSKKGR